MVNVAVPPLKEADPSNVTPSLKVTIPDAWLGTTVEVKVTLVPYMEGFRLEVTKIVVASRVAVPDVAVVVKDNRSPKTVEIPLPATAW